MQKLLILFFILTALAGYTQPKFNNDTSYRPFYNFLFEEIDSTFRLSKNNEFEFRLLITHSRTMANTLFILSLKNNHWSARLFERTRMRVDTLIERPVNQQDLVKLWKELEKNNVLTIPESHDLRDRKGNEIDLFIHDGMYFRFELLTADNKRSYSYHCPKAYQEEYKYIKAYRNVVSIIRLIYKYCAIKPAYICKIISATVHTVSNPYAS